MKHAFAIVAVLLGGLATFSAGCRLSDPSCDLQSTETESATNPTPTASETEGGSDTSSDTGSDTGSDTTPPMTPINISVTVTTPDDFVDTPLKLILSFYKSLPATGMPGWMIKGPDVTTDDIGPGKSYVLTVSTQDCIGQDFNTKDCMGLAVSTPPSGTVYGAVALLTNNKVATVNCDDWASYVDTPIDLSGGKDVDLGTVELAIFDPKGDCPPTK